MPGGTVPPDPWEIIKVTIALFDALYFSAAPEQRAQLDECREQIERWRAALKAEG